MDFELTWLFLVMLVGDWLKSLNSKRSGSTVVCLLSFSNLCFLFLDVTSDLLMMI
jgi:hypothetical protein